MRTLLLIGFFAAAPFAWGGALRVDSVPTTDLPGFRTYTFSIELEPGEVFRGVDATFTGPMNQVNPAGNASVFNDDVKFFPFIFGWDPTQDSRFLFCSSDVLSIGAEESDSLLKAAITGLPDFNGAGTISFAWIATNRPAELQYDLQFDLGGVDPVPFSGFVVPEPTTAAMLACLIGALVATRRAA